MTLLDAVKDLYIKAHVEKASTSTIRLKGLAELCIEQVAARGIRAATREVKVPGGGRDKFWDVGWSYHGAVRLAISLKSILANVSGAVPNRLDELVGEAANAQMMRPEIVLGYMCVFDKSKDSLRREDGRAWSDWFEARVLSVAGRAAPAWSVGTVEAAAMIYVDFSSGANLTTRQAELDAFFDTLVGEVKRREPLA